jgi:hypothetical protein
MMHWIVQPHHNEDLTDILRNTQSSSQLALVDDFLGEHANDALDCETTSQ